jgi:hypothetical protein
MSQAAWEEWLARRQDHQQLNIAWSGKFVFQDEDDD